MSGTDVAYGVPEHTRTGGRGNRTTTGDSRYVQSRHSEWPYRRAVPTWRVTVRCAVRRVAVENCAAHSL
eukprot:695785-Rhodomonas_salina.3